MKRAAATLCLAVVGCASPGYEMSIPAQVAVALAGGDPAAVPADTPPMTVHAWWYDRDVQLRITQEGRIIDLTTAADAENATKAHGVDVEALKGLSSLLAILAPTVP